ncbi:hypothetical protein LIER_09046 [Lithospermum erythrorhizon]|uniref:At4g14310 8-bladed propeller domain-containing protein n=1 Tax=Lithospermum erythrorhizon TaxID=34254 RepID=A0AAV3PFY2_LITER
MPTPSIHRIKQPITTTTKPLKTQTPFSQNGPHKSSSGKENSQLPASRPRATSATRTKPMMMPRIDKPSVDLVVNGGQRWSMGMSRGRSASPCEFGSGNMVSVDRVGDKLIGNRRSSEIGKRVLAKSEKNGVFVCDLKMVESRKVSSRGGGNVGGNGVSVDRVAEKFIGNRRSSEIGKRVLEKNEVFVGDLKMVEDRKVSSRGGGNVGGNGVCCGSVERRLSGRAGCGDKVGVLEELKAKGCVEKCLKLLGSEELRSNGDTELKPLNGNVELREQSGTFTETVIKSSSGNVVETYGLKVLLGSRTVDLSEKDHVLEEVKVRASSEKSEKLTSKGSRVVGRSSFSSGGLREKTVIEEGKGSSSSTLSAKRYPSKLHEKLAFLEGKVKKIASDIKQTKVMLDLNNPDASKLMLSDIQEKISGIEKAMSNVSVGNASARLLKDDDNEEREVRDEKRSIKGLSVQELEARLFSHHKLLKDRTCPKPSSEFSQIDESREGELNRNQEPQDKSRSPTEENLIALQFLESLKNEQSGILVEAKNQDTESSEDVATENSSASLNSYKKNYDFLQSVNEKFEEFDEQENTSRMVIAEENENSGAYMLKEIGNKISTGGWFVTDGEAVLLAHNDNSCSYYDITNSEEKAEYKPPVENFPNMWQDCWIVRASSADGCSGKYVVAASAGNSIEAGFCSWDFYTKDVKAFHVENVTASVRIALADLPNNTMHRRSALSSTTSLENQRWFYKPCGPLIVSTASCQKSVKVYDIRDGEHVMRWELQKPVATMEYSSPLQWRNRGKVVVAGTETLSLWDVSSLNPQPLVSVSSFNRKISALHVNNTDAELGGGVRQRVGSSEVEGNDGVFCTPDSINVLDFRQPSGIGLKIPNVGVDVQSAFSLGDSVLLGCTSLRSAGKKQFSSQIQQFSLCGQKLVSAYVLPDSNAHSHHKAITQVWGNSNLVMGVCGLGLCIYDSSKDEGLLPYTLETAKTNNVKDVIGPDDLYYPSFDYLGSRVLLISRDRPALWRYVS